MQCQQISSFLVSVHRVVFRSHFLHNNETRHKRGQLLILWLCLRERSIFGISLFNPSRRENFTKVSRSRYTIEVMWTFGSSDQCVVNKWCIPLRLMNYCFGWWQSPIINHFKKLEAPSLLYILLIAVCPHKVSVGQSRDNLYKADSRRCVMHEWKE